MTRKPVERWNGWDDGAGCCTARARGRHATTAEMTLKARLAQGPIPVDKAIDIARQVAAGLARAHE